MLLPVISIDAESGLGHARYLVLLVITVILLVVLGTPGSTTVLVGFLQGGASRVRVRVSMGCPEQKCHKN